MPILKATNVVPHVFRAGASRVLLHTENLMVVVIDFYDGPWNAPDPFHHHVHEQVTYVASGEILFMCEGEDDQKLTAGDLFAVPSGTPHAIKLLSKEARLIDSFTPVRQDFL